MRVEISKGKVSITCGRGREGSFSRTT
jgi:hypothetical protein